MPHPTETNSRAISAEVSVFTPLPETPAPRAPGSEDVAADVSPLKPGEALVPRVAADVSPLTSPNFGANAPAMLPEENSGEVKSGLHETLDRSRPLSAPNPNPNPNPNLPAPIAPSIHQSTNPPIRALTAAATSEAVKKLSLVLAARQLRAQNIGWEQIGRILSINWNTLYSWCDSVRDLAHPTAADLLVDRSSAGRPRKYTYTDSDLAALRANYLITNRTAESGSVQEACRMALRKHELSPGLATYIRTRDEARLPLLPESLHRKVVCSAAVVKQHRSPKNANLDYISAPGSTMWTVNEQTGEEEFIRAGHTLEADDGTVNFGVCVPWQIGGCKVSDRWGVKLGRFQWLPAIDVGSRFVPGWTYTMRPKSSYRAEDILALLLGIFRQHGLWNTCRFEQGAWKANRVQDALQMLGVNLQTVHSPHAKPYIEGFFNFVWTKLSDLPGQVGRFRGEEEKQSKLFQACQDGSQDPRKHFPMLADTLTALTRVVTERNSQRVESTNYGTWIPEERWQDHRVGPVPSPGARMRPLDPASEWTLSPCVREWTVQGCLVGGTIPIMDGFSVRFDFAAEYLAQFHGCKVKAYFDPSAPNCAATIVLTQNIRNHKSGEVLGVAIQANKVARYARRVMGWGDDPDLGLEARKKAASALRREVRTILPGGKPGVSTTEIRDGLGNSIVATRDPVGPMPSSGAPSNIGPIRPISPISPRGAFTPPSDTDRAKRSENLKRQAANANRLRELQEQLA